MVQETLEIGAYALNAYGQVTGQFSRLVKPVLHPQMSHFCRKLTNISQAEVNRARDFKRVIAEFQNWIGIDYEDYLLASWGRFDRDQLMADCRLHRMDDYWLDEHIDLKQQYADIRKLPKKRGLKSAVKHEGYSWEGEEHRALPDAQNTVKIFRELIDVWRY